MLSLGESAVADLRDETWSLLGELIALRAEGQRLRRELESWPPSYVGASTELPRTFDDQPLPEPFDQRPTWVPDGEDDRPTLRC